MKISVLRLSILALVSLLCPFVFSAIETPPGPYVGYLFLHFYDQPPDYNGPGEQVFGHLSDGNNAVSYYPLNSGRPLLSSNVGTGGVRDFYLASTADESQHYLIATDLNAVVSGFGGPLSLNIVVWESFGPSLTSWRAPRLVKFVPDNFRMVWAPEAYWIDSEKRFIVFWSSSQYADASRTGGSDYAKIYYAYTPDFRSFTEPELYLDLVTEDVIDLTMHWTGTWNHFVRFYKRGKGATGRCHGQLSVNGMFGPFDDIGTVDQYVDNDFQNEACLFFRDNVIEGNWWVWVDEYGKNPDGYHAYKADNSITNYGYTEQRFNSGFPPKTKHGCVKHLTQTQYDEIKAAWG